MEAAAASTEIHVLAWSVALLLAQIVLQAVSIYDLGPSYLLGPRDQEQESRNPVAGRLKRALENLLETYPAYIALALALAITGKAGGIAATGAWVWLLARVVYLPLYAFGVPALRTLAWCISIVGLVMMLWQLMA
jgi:uncharacterized MAPEG superfamily protein